MKIKDMQNIKNQYDDAIGFLHHTEHSYLQHYGIMTSNRSFYNITDQIIAFYKLKHLSNKQVAKLLNICCNANPLTLS